ncbi:MAG: class I SAM-dependent methyltransferase [Ilumatobacteraceae bacterium]
MTMVSRSRCADSTMETFFGDPVTWRAEAAEALGFSGDELPAAISPGAAFPAALRCIVDNLPSPLRTIVDVGSGVGGASEYLRRATGATVYAVEPSQLARETARRCFPHLRQVPGEGTHTGLPGGIADAVVLCGVLSLIAEPHGVITEAARLLSPVGHLAIADLFALGTFDRTSPPNVFRTPETVIELCATQGLAVVAIGCGAPTPDPAWSSVAARVDGWITRACRDREGYAAWYADRLHLDRHISRGDLVGGCIIVSRPRDEA